MFWTVSTTSRRVSVSSLLLRDELSVSCRPTLFPVVRRRFLPSDAVPVLSRCFGRCRVATVVSSSVGLLRRLVADFYKVCVSVCFGINLGKLLVLTSSDKPEVKQGRLK